MSKTITLELMKQFVTEADAKWQRNLDFARDYNEKNPPNRFGLGGMHVLDPDYSIPAFITWAEGTQAQEGENTSEQ